jgi:hypothetical protein
VFVHFSVSPLQVAEETVEFEIIREKGPQAADVLKAFERGTPAPGRACASGPLLFAIHVSAIRAKRRQVCGEVT